MPIRHTPSSLSIAPQMLKAKFAGICGVLFLATQALTAAEQGSFAKEVAPILVRKCLACHNEEKSKGGYRLDDTRVLLKAGDSDELPVVAGKPEASSLYSLLVKTDPDERMPQKDEALPKADIEAIRRWIEAGAALPSETVRLSALVPRIHSAPPAVYHRPAPANALAMSPDGSQLAVGGINEVVLWESSGAKMLSRITNLPPQIQSLDFSPDGTWLAVAGGLSGQFGEASVIRTGEPATRKMLLSLKDLVLDARFSRDGKLLAVSGADNAVRLFSTADWKETRVLQQHSDWVVSVAFSVDGKHLVTASRDKTVRVSNLEDGQLEATYMNHGAPVLAAVFSEDGKLVFSGGRDRVVHAWRVSDGKEQFRLKEPEADIQRLIVRSNDLFVASADRLIRHYRIDTKSLVRKFEGHRDWVQSLVLPKAGEVLFSGGFDGEVRVWKLANGELDRRFVPTPGM